MPSRNNAVKTPDKTDEALLHRVRNLWQFANLCQWIYIFGKAAKIDESIDVEEIETDCLKPNSPLLAGIALSLLKLISSHRGLTLDIFDDQARKQFIAKSSSYNPFGDHESPVNFESFDVFTKIRVLQQMTQWCLIHPERLREKMEEQRDAEQTSWRIEPYGWDGEDRTYFVLDDNRVYRMTEASSDVPQKTKKRKPQRSARRASKRQRTSLNDDEVDQPEREPEDKNSDGPDSADVSLGGMKWECLAVTLDEVRQLLSGFHKTRDDNERILRRQLENHLLPLLEKEEEARQRKVMQRDRELLNLAKLANAKRSSRIAGKVEQQKQDQKEKEEVERLLGEQRITRFEEQDRTKRADDRNQRMASRGQRLKERQDRRFKHEQELAHLSEDSKNVDETVSRISERRLLVEIERKRQALRDLDEENEEWVFDCACGMYGQVDDGTHSVACEKCNVWQHSRCLGITEEAAERPEFHFVCQPCQGREHEGQELLRPVIKLKMLQAARSRSTSRDSEQAHDTAASPPTKLSQPTCSPSSLASSWAKHYDKGALQRQLLGAGKDASSHTFSTHSLDGLVLSPKQHRRSSAGNEPDTILGPEASLTSNGSPQKKTPVAKGTDQRLVSQAYGRSPDTVGSKTNQTPTGYSMHLSGQDSTSFLLSTPNLNRNNPDVVPQPNGNLPSQAGISPLKQSPHSSFHHISSSKLNGSATLIPPGATLSPSPHEAILTPPVKLSETARPPTRQ